MAHRSISITWHILRHTMGVLLLCWRRAARAGAMAGLLAIIATEIVGALVTRHVPPSGTVHMVALALAAALAYGVAVTVILDELITGVVEAIRMLMGEAEAGARAAAAVTEREVGEASGRLFRAVGLGTLLDRASPASLAAVKLVFGRDDAAPTPATQAAPSTQADRAGQAATMDAAPVMRGAAATGETLAELADVSPRPRVDAQPVRADQLPRLEWTDEMPVVRPPANPERAPEASTVDTSHAATLAPDAPAADTGAADTQAGDVAIADAPTIPLVPVGGVPVPAPVPATRPLAPPATPAPVTRPLYQEDAAEAAAAPDAVTAPAGAAAMDAPMPGADGASLGLAEPAEWHAGEEPPADATTWHDPMMHAEHTDDESTGIQPVDLFNALPSTVPDSAPDAATPATQEATLPITPETAPGLWSGGSMWEHISRVLSGTEPLGPLPEVESVPLDSPETLVDTGDAGDASHAGNAAQAGTPRDTGDAAGAAPSDA